MKEVILHVGMHKTATTSVQESLYYEGNQEIFEKYNITYVDEISSCNVEIASAFMETPERFAPNIRQLFSLEQINNNSIRTKELLIKKLNQDGRLLISCENLLFLSSVEMENLKNFIATNCKERVKFKVIMCVRNPVSFIPSIYQEDRKTCYLSGFDFEKGVIESQYSNIDMPSKVFDKNDLVTYSFEEACTHKQGPVGYFFSLVGLSDEDINKLTYIKDNEGSCQEAVNIISFINDREPLYIDYKINKKREAWDWIELRNIIGSKFYLENYIIENTVNSIQDKLIFLKNEFEIDYTNLEKNYEKNKPIENVFDELSIINTYLLCTDFIRSEIREYYKLQNNVKLVEALKQTEKFMVKHNQLKERHGVLLKILNLDTQNLELPEKIAIYGLGDNGKALYNKINDISSIVCFIDANPQVSAYDNIPVVKLEDFCYQKDVKIIVTPSYAYSQIKNNLIEKHSINDKNIISIEAIFN